MRALVAGAGYVGAELAKRLVAAGCETLVLRRSAAAPPPGARALRADLAAPGALAALPPVDLVFYTAAADERSDAAYRRIYVDGLARLVESLVRIEPAPQRLLFTSSTAVYGQAHGEWVDEASPTEPDGFAGRRMLEAEAVALAAPFAATVLRLGGIYGPGRTSLVAQARAGVPGSSAYTNRIHRDDAAAALLHLARLPSAEGVVIGVDSEPARGCEVVAWLAAQLGLPAPQGDAPAPQRPRGDKRCRNARLLATGFAFAYPTFREGYAALLSEGRSAARSEGGA